MKDEYRTLEEMTDSRELLEAKPNPVIPLFIYLLIIILVSAITWTYFGEMDEVVKANGVIRSSETISTVQNQLAGEVKEIYFGEGQVVEEGDKLFELDQSDQDLKKKQLEEERDQYENKLEDLHTLKESIDNGEDLFNEKHTENNQVYERYISYKTNLSLMKGEFDGKSIEINQQLEEQNMQKEQLTEQKETIIEKIEQLERMQDAIKKEENIFSKDETPYYNRLENIISTITHRKDNMEELKEEYKSLDEKRKNPSNTDGQELDDVDSNGIRESTNQEQNELITSEQVNNAKNAYKEAEYELEQYINQQLSEIDLELQQKEEQLQDINISLDSLDTQNKIQQNQEENYQSTIDNFTSETLIQVDNDIETVEQQINQLSKDLTTLEEQMKIGVVKAPIDGVVNTKTHVREGDFLQAGTEVLTIVPNSKESTFKVQLTILNEDIAETKVGDKVDLSIHSLPYQEYGHIEGEITKISADALNDPETGTSFYAAEAVIENGRLYSYKGEPAQVKVGMTTEAHIVSGSKKILYFLLEKINLKE
ncbi:HlyD family efflux transporter periplasmic adaptor subunit [Gracilibacillus lacisalsi]|uniref:HlyD family efflux transporter periplasmic adaptor subunit n=1 Tax=Gracilibacillus lacisalsi TaxID=393087 RepID=UPI0003804F2B|nr:HlyD family efflux transporter periplasmic adaptor subunit [Gracilibacillus lacisalsi]